MKNHHSSEAPCVVKRYEFHSLFYYFAYYFEHLIPSISLIFKTHNCFFSAKIAGLKYEGLQ